MATVPETFAELLDRLGKVPLDRIRLKPPPGTATVEDLIEVYEQEFRICELIDGVLVEKAVGLKESFFAVILLRFLNDYLDQHPLGALFGEAGFLRLFPGLVRAPDISFISWDRLPGGEIPDDPVPDIVPDLAIEILSKNNTRKEMQRKLKEYFQAGVRLVWMIQPKLQTAEAYHTATNPKRLGKEDTLSGEPVLPGFSLALKDFFARAYRASRRPNK